MTPAQEQSGRSSAFTAAVATAALAAVVTLGAAGYMFAVGMRGRAEHPLDSPRWLALKRKLAETPLSDEAARQPIIAELRQLDAELRERYFERRQRLAAGAYVVGISGGVALLAGGAALWLSRRRAAPGGRPPTRDESRATARLGRLAVGLTLAGVAGGVVWAALREPPLAPLEPPPVPERAPPNVAEAEQAPWPRFRGPGGAGIAGRESIPSAWNGETGEGVLWRSDEIPLPGKSSPIVWGDRIFLTGATKDEREVYCFSTADGKLLWRRSVEAEGLTPEFDEAMGTGWAAATPVTDGRYVCAIFPTGDLVCFDFDGNELWARNLGTPENLYGFATSLLMHGGRLIVQFDQGSDLLDEEDPDTWASKLLILDPSNGETLFSVPRPVRDSWTSPIVAKVGGRQQLITLSNPYVISHDPSSGEILWKADLMGADPAPSPIVANGRIVAAAPNASVYLLRPEPELEEGEDRVVWQAEAVVPEVTSPVTDGERVYVLTSWGTLGCYDLQSGSILWVREFGEPFNASPSLVGDKLYLTNTDGVTYIVGAGPFDFSEARSPDEPREGLPKGAVLENYETFEWITADVAACPLGEPVHGSLAFQDGRIYIRGAKHLFCIGRE